MSLKQVERAWRRLWITALTRLLAHRRGVGRAGTGWDERPHRVLFLRHDRIGDMIVSTGLIRAIAGAHPDRHLDVLASPRNAPVVRDDPYIERVLTVDVRHPWRSMAVVRQLREARYDVVVDCMPTAPSLTTLLLMLVSGARERVGVAGRGNDAAMTIAVPPQPGARHIVDHLAALAAAFDVDVRTADFSPRLVLAADELERALALWGGDREGRTSRRLLVNVSAGKVSRRWPESSFAEVLDGVRARHPDLRLLVIGAADERERVAAIAGRCGAEVAETAGLRDALALVATADVVLTPDTSIAHAASAFRTPTVDLLLRGRAAAWGLYGTPGHSLESAGETLESLPPAPVLASLLDVLRSLEPVSEPLLESTSGPPAGQPAPPLAAAAGTAQPSRRDRA
ncbi:MAG: glycosyltransferase family 9 protein [Gemmatimonadaceae bacterium]